MAGKTKADIEFHSDRMCWPSHPAINVKVYNYPDAWDVADELGCSEDTARKVLQMAFESSQEVFWNETMAMLAEQHLVPHFGTVECYSEGRSSGWLVMTNNGTRDVVEDHWDAIDVSTWHRFADAVRKEVKWMTSADYVLDLIRANGWHEDDIDDPGDWDDDDID